MTYYYTQWRRRILVRFRSQIPFLRPSQHISPVDGVFTIPRNLSNFIVSCWTASRTHQLFFRFILITVGAFAQQLHVDLKQ